jgi:3-phosphoshikimate 1-carboxyvinyltransferase
VDSRGDHRIAMAMLVGGLAAAGPITVSDTGCIATSFPRFLPLLEEVARR